MLRTMRCLLLTVLFSLLSLAAERRPIFPPSAKPVGPYSPGVMIGDYLYVSGQGARDTAGQLPDGIEAQTKQCLENVKSIVEAAGLTMEHVVFTHTYLADMKNYAAMNRVYATYFPGVPPARATMGVTRMPTETPVEISAVAVRDKAVKKAVQLPGAQSPVPLSPGILTSERFYLSGILGRDAEANTIPSTTAGQVAMAIDRMRRVLQSAQLTPEHIVALSVYRTAQMPEAEILSALTKVFPARTAPALTLLEAGSLPFGANVGLTGVAVRDLKAKKVFRTNAPGNPLLLTTCATAGDTAYCAARGVAETLAETKSGKPVADQTTERFTSLKAQLQGAGFNLSDIVASNVYLDSIDDFAAMNKAYGANFTAAPPTRTTVQPLKPAQAAGTAGWPALVRIGVVAAK